MMTLQSEDCRSGSRVQGTSGLQTTAYQMNVSCVNLPLHDCVVWILCNRIKMDAKCERSPSEMRKILACFVACL